MLGALLLGTLAWSPASAQEQSGWIQGVVKDAQGAVLPGATVKAKSPVTAPQQQSRPMPLASIASPRSRREPTGLGDLQGFRPGDHQKSSWTSARTSRRPRPRARRCSRSSKVTAEASPLIDSKETQPPRRCRRKPSSTCLKGGASPRFCVWLPGRSRKRRLETVQVQAQRVRRCK